MFCARGHLVHWNRQHTLYDSRGLQTEVSYPGTKTIEYAYNALRQLTSLTENGNATNYTYYSDSGLLKSLHYPGDDTTTNQYDNLKRLIQRTDGLSAVTKYKYEQYGKLTDITYPADETKNVKYHYDSLLRNDWVTDPSGRQDFAYYPADDTTASAGRLHTVSTTYTGMNAKTIDYAYNAIGQRATMTTPGGIFSYSYDDKSRLTGLTSPIQATPAPSPLAKSSWQYRWDDTITQQTLSTGAVTDYDRTVLGQRLTGVTNKVGGVMSSQFNGATYDWKAKIKGLNATVAGKLAPFTSPKTFAYDNDTLGRLTQETQYPGDNFTMDSSDNIKHFPGHELAVCPDPLTYDRKYNSKNQWVGYEERANTANTVGTDLFEYDNNGNPTYYKGQNARYDRENRLTKLWAADTKVTPPADPAAIPLFSAGYRADGLRVWKDVSTTVGAVITTTRTYFIYDGDQIVNEFNTAGEITAVNTWGPVGLIERRDARGDVFYQLDMGGNVVQRFNRDNTLRSTDSFDAYGNRIEIAGTDEVADAKDPFGYRAKYGYYTDAETGLILCLHRYYDPAAGRWLTRDPIGYPGGLNLYAYCGDEPVRGVDQSGYKAFASSTDFSLGNWGNARLVIDEDGSYSVYLPGRGWVPLYHTDEDDKYGQVLDENNNQIKDKWDQCLNPEEIKVAMSHESELIPAFREWKRNQSSQYLSVGDVDAGKNPDGEPLVFIFNTTGIKIMHMDYGKPILRPDTWHMLQQAGMYVESLNKGYTIQVKNAFRSHEDQVHFWNLFKNGGNVAAQPREIDANGKVLHEGSRHERGYAVDLRIVGSNGNDIDVATQDRIMFSPEAGQWARLSIEAWHYEYGSENQKNRPGMTF